jgi:uncharacterized RDD family membrane protein YckC
MSFGNIPCLSGVGTWGTKCALFGRLLGFGEGLGWVWLIAAAHLFFYVLLALLFRRGMEKCAETLEQRPGSSILAAFLTMLLTPLVFLLLAITGIGIVVIPFLAAGLFFGGKFGRAVMHAWLGRIFTRHFGDSPFAHVAVAVLIGGVIISLLYCVPVLGFLTYFLIGTLGLGVVIYTLILGMKKEKTATPTPPAATTVAGLAPTVPPAIPPVLPATPGEAASIVAADTPVGAPIHGSPSPLSVLGSLPIRTATPPPTPVTAATLPRASFWLRMGALAIDLLLVGFTVMLVNSMLPHGFGIGFGGFLLVVAAYAAVLWKLRATTIGGIVCNLKVMRLDDRPLDWTMTIVRALSCFISMIVAGLGFIWIAIDDDHQSWHDKIAGTVVVRVPKGTPLI